MEYSHSLSGLTIISPRGKKEERVEYCSNHKECGRTLRQIHIRRRGGWLARSEEQRTEERDGRTREAKKCWFALSHRCQPSGELTQSIAMRRHDIALDFNQTKEDLGAYLSGSTSFLAIQVFLLASEATQVNGS